MSDTSKKAQGVVTEVSEFHASVTEDGGPPGYDIVITVGDETGTTTGDSVDERFADGARVTIEPAGAAPAITGTAVPLTALRSDGGTTYVLVATAEVTATRKVVVEVEGTADGYAVITGDVSDGDKVVVNAR